jgi:hypothetical protein
LPNVALRRGELRAPERRVRHLGELSLQEDQQAAGERANAEQRAD